MSHVLWYFPKQLFSRAWSWDFQFLILPKPHRAIHFVQLCLCDNMNRLNRARRACFVTSLHCFSHWYIYISERLCLLLLALAVSTCPGPFLKSLSAMFSPFQLLLEQVYAFKLNKLCLFFIAPVGCSHDQNSSELLQPAQNCPSQPIQIGEARDESSLWTLSEESRNTLGLQWVLLHRAEFRSRQKVESIANL